MPRVGPPAATCSSIVLGFLLVGASFGAGLSGPLALLRRRGFAAPSPASGVASSRCVSAVSAGLSSEPGVFPPRPLPPPRRRLFRPGAPIPSSARAAPPAPRGAAPDSALGRPVRPGSRGSVRRLGLRLPRLLLARLCLRLRLVVCFGFITGRVGRLGCARAA